MSVEFAFCCLCVLILLYGLVQYIAVGILIQEFKDEIIDEIRKGEQQ